MASLTDNADVPSGLAETLHGAHSDKMCMPELHLPSICFLDAGSDDSVPPAVPKANGFQYAICTQACWATRCSSTAAEPSYCNCSPTGNIDLDCSTSVRMSCMIQGQAVCFAPLACYHSRHMHIRTHTGQNHMSAESQGVTWDSL